jgi:maleate cis-trans isomerase
MDLPDAYGIADVQPEQILAYVQHHLSGVNADCLFISCANLRSLEAIDAIRGVSPIPVVTSNQAVLEEIKRVLNIDAQDPPVGVPKKE